MNTEEQQQNTLGIDKYVVTYSDSIEISECSSSTHQLMYSNENNRVTFTALSLPVQSHAKGLIMHMKAKMNIMVQKSSKLREHHLMLIRGRLPISEVCYSKKEIIFMVDCSKSMCDYIEVVRTCMKAALKILMPHFKINIMTFGVQARFAFLESLDVTQDNLARVNTLLDSIIPPINPEVDWPRWWKTTWPINPPSLRHVYSLIHFDTL